MEYTRGWEDENKQMRASFPAIEGFLWEMNRTRPRVLASRKVAAYLHSSAVWTESDYGFAGVPKERVSELLKNLHAINIWAQLDADLDACVQQVIDTLGCQEKCATNGEHDTQVTKDAQVQALSLATQGDTPCLRKLSLQGASAVFCARDEQDHTCLHVMAQAGHYHTCKWLLT